MASIETTSPTRACGGQPLRQRGLAVLAVATLTVPAFSTLAPSVSAAPRLPSRSGPVTVGPDSHRLAAAVATSHSLRLT
jgi:hypothetical protein